MARLVPIDYDPFASPSSSGPRLVAVDYDPFDVAAVYEQRRRAGTLPAPDRRDVEAEARLRDRALGVEPYASTPEDNQVRNRIAAGIARPGEEEALVERETRGERGHDYFANADAQPENVRDVLAFIGTVAHTASPQTVPWLYHADGSRLSGQEIGDIVMRGSQRIEGMSPRDAALELFAGPELRPSRTSETAALGQHTSPPAFQADPLNADLENPATGGEQHERRGYQDFGAARPLTEEQRIERNQQRDFNREVIQQRLSRFGTEGPGFAGGMAQYLMGVSQRVTGGIVGALGTVLDDIGGAAGQDTSGAHFLQNIGRYMGERGLQRETAATPDYRQFSPEWYAFQGTEALVEMGGALAGSIATKNPALVTSTLMGLRVFAEQYDDSVRQGRTPNEALIDGTAYGMFEMIPENMALHEIWAPGQRFLRRTVTGVAAEGAQEMITEALQAGWDAGILNQQMTTRQALERIGSAGLLGGIVGGPVGLGSHGMEHLGARRAAREAGQREIDAAAITELDPNKVDPSDPNNIASLRSRAGVETALPPHRPGIIEQAGTAEITPQDEASPIPTDLIAEGRSVIDRAAAGQKADDILDQHIGHRTGDRVSVTIGDQTREGEIKDAFTEDDPEQGPQHGAVIQWDHGGESRERFTDLHDAGARIERPGARIEGANAREIVRQHIARAENSTGNPNARNSRSSASGPYQFTDGTFRSYYQRVYGRDPGEHPPEALKNDRQVQDRLMDAMLDDNERALRHNHHAVTAGNLYLSHFLGPAGANAVLSNPNATVEQSVGAQVIAANPFLRGMTGADVAAWAEARMAGTQYAGGGTEGVDYNDPTLQPDFSWIDEPLATLDRGDELPVTPPATTEPVGDGTREAPVQVTEPAHLDLAAARVEQPTEAQAEAGNYRAGHIRLHGLDITIETPRGAERSGSNPDGSRWTVPSMSAHYGYVKRTNAADGEQIDVYVGPEPSSMRAFWIDQIHADTGQYDEAKVMLGYRSKDAALADYQAAFSDGRGGDRIGAVTGMSVERVHDLLKESQTGPIGEIGSYTAPEQLSDESGQLNEAQPSAEVGQFDPAPQIAVERNSVVIRNATEGVLSTIRAALPLRARPMMRSDGAFTLPKKYEAAVRSAIAEQVAPEVGSSDASDARNEADARVPNLAGDEEAVLQPEVERVSSVRRRRNNDSPGLDSQLSGVLGGSRTSPDAEALDRPNRREKGIRAGERAVGDADRASAKQDRTKQPATDVSREDANRGDVGETKTNERSDDNRALEQRVERLEGVVEEKTRDEKIRASRAQSDEGRVGGAARDGLPDAHRQVEPGLERGKDAERAGEIAGWPDTPALRSLLRDWQNIREAGRDPKPVWAVRNTADRTMLTWSVKKGAAEEARQAQWEPDLFEVVRVQPEAFADVTRPADVSAKSENADTSTPIAKAKDALQQAMTALDAAEKGAPVETPQPANEPEERPRRNQSLFQRRLNEGENPIFYSALERAVEASSTTRASAAQWSATLGRAAGVKREELEWSGVFDWLDMQEGPVSRDDLLGVIRDGGIKVEEVVLGKPSQAQIEEAADSILENVVADQMSDGLSEEDARDFANSNYSKYLENAEWSLREETTPQFGSWSSDPNNDTYRELLITLPIAEGGNPERDFATHWDQSAVVAHARFMDKTDADGKRVLFVEEIQSDRHQAGRDKGYEQKVDPETIQRTLTEADKAQDDKNAAYDRLNKLRGGNDYEAAEGARRDWETATLRYNEARQAYLNATGTQGVPDAPFKSSWPALVMKRLIRYAADSGFDKIAWATGTEQAERYSLDKHIGRVELAYSSGGVGVPPLNEPFRVGVLFAYDPNGREVVNRYVNLDENPRAIHDLIGGELADRLLAQPAKAGQSAGMGAAVRKLDGLDLRTGGEGMRAFYDRNLVNLTNDLIKKYGGKVGDVRMLPHGRYRVGPTGSRFSIFYLRDGAQRTGQPVVSQFDTEQKAQREADRLNDLDATRNPGFTITPAMADAARSGFSLFQRGPAVNRRTFIKGATAVTGGFMVGDRLFAQPPGLTSILERSMNEVVPLTGPLEWIASNSENAQFRRFARRMVPLVNGVVIRGAHQGEAVHPDGTPVPEDMSEGLAHGMHQTDEVTDGDVIWLGRGELVNGFNEGTVVHEALHAAIYRLFGRLSVRMGGNDPALLRREGFNRESAPRPASEAQIAELRGLYQESVTAFENMVQHGAFDAPSEQDRVRHLRNALGSPDEFLSWALENPDTQSFLRSQPARGGPAGQTLWDKIIAFIRHALGLGDTPRTALDDTLDTAYRLLAEPAGPTRESNQVVENPTAAEFNRGSTTGRSALQASSRIKRNAFPDNGIETTYLTERTGGPPIPRGMNIGDYDLFARKVMLDELSVADPDNLPFGFSEETLAAAQTKIDALVNKTESVREAVRKYHFAQMLTEAANAAEPGAFTEASQREPIEGEPPRAANVRMDKLESIEDIRTALEVSADRFDQFKGARRGVVSREETQALANDLDMTVEQLTARRRGQAFNAHELLASRQLLVASANDLVEKARQAEGGSDADLLAFRKAWVRHVAIQEQVSGMTAEAGRALNQFKMVSKAGGDLNARMMREIIETEGGRGDVEKVAKSILGFADDPAKMNRFARQAYSPTWRDKLFELWINGLLSGPATHAVNALSNAITAITQIPEFALASGIGKVRSLSKPETDRILRSEVAARAMGMIQGAKEGAQLAAEALRSGEGSDVLSKLEARTQRAISGKKGEIIRTPSRLLIVGDELFKGMARRMELEAQAARIATREGLTGDEFKERAAALVADPTEEMVTKAMDYARYSTFQRPLGEMGQAITHVINKVPGMRLIVPFIRTPANIFKFAIARTPAAPILKEVRDDIKAGGAARDLAVARIIIGTSLGATVMLLAVTGIVTGGDPDDDNARRLLHASGWQPYSVKIGDTYYSYQRLDPLATILGLAADLAMTHENMSADETESAYANLFSAILNQLKNKTFLSGIGNLIEAIEDPGRFGPSFIGRLAGTVIPTGVAQINNQIDPVMRDTRQPSGGPFAASIPIVGTSIDRSIATIESRIPGLSDNLPARRDVWGRVMVREGGVGPDFASPFWTTTDQHDAVVQELLRAGVSLNVPSRRVGGVELSPQQYDQYQVLAGQYLRADAEDLVGSDEWADMSQQERVEAFDEVKNDARRAARGELGLSER